ncbi:MAG: hypothetical protein IK080_07980 [Clostridia bacterium]|nr:hypothetical protein [Clostridia bacterium]
MEILDLASKGIVTFTKGFGRKIQRTVRAAQIPQASPIALAGETWRLGFAGAEIMPDLNAGKTYYIAGHGSGHVMEGVLTPVSMFAAWIDCGGDEGILWLSADIIGLTRVEVNAIRKKILASDKIKGCRCINFSCTHSHSGIDTVGYWGKPNAVGIPSDGKDADYMALLFSTAVEVAEAAYAARRPGKLYSGRVEVPGGLFTKRDFPDKHEILTRVRFVPEDGGRETWILNFGAHPNSLGGDNRMLSGEYPYFLREKLADVNVLFTIGAIGAMDAAELDPDDKVNNIKLQGEMVADAALRIDNDRLLAPQIRLVQQPFYLPVGNYVLTFLAMRNVMSIDPYPTDKTDIGVALMSEMTYFTLGDQAFLLLPGENFVNTVYGSYVDQARSTTGKGPEINPAPLAEIAGDPEMIAVGVTNDMTGYVVPPNDFLLNPTQPYLNGVKDRNGLNHYHETNSLGIGAQQAIADNFTRMLAAYRAQ